MTKDELSEKIVNNRRMKRMAESKLKGLLKANSLMVVQLKKNMIGDNGDYFYNIALSDGVDMIVVTAGKAADGLELLKRYNFGFEFVDKKLKMTSYELAS